METSFKQVYCFGERARLYAKRMPRSVPAILTDGSLAAEALAKAVELRRNGIPFLFFPLMDNPRASLERMLASHIFSSLSAADDRRLAFEALSKGLLTFGDKRIDELIWYDDSTLSTLSDLMFLADGIVFRSPTERYIIEGLLSAYRPFVTIAPYEDITIPPTLPDADADRILVWAPSENAEALALYLYALSDLKKPALLVCRGNVPGSMHTFVDPAHAEEALRQAAVIVDTNLTDPGASLAFAERGYGIVAARTSGAHDFIQGITTYAPSSFLEVSGAVMRSRGMRRTRLHTPPATAADLSDLLEFSTNPLPKDLPLVTIVIPTHNRPHAVRKQLELFSRQSYPNIEVIIVNDSGESVEEIVAEFPFARYLVTSQNLGCTRAVMFGYQHAAGEYIGCIADDDIQYPHHIADCMTAMQAAKHDVVYANVLSRMDALNEEGKLVTTGHAVTFKDDFDRTQALYFYSFVTIAGFLTSKAALESMPPLHEKFPHSNDPVHWLTLSESYDFCHVDRVSGEFRVRNDGTTFTSQNDFSDHIIQERKDLFDHFLPPDRPLIKMRQEQSWANLKVHGTIPTAAISLQTPLEVAP